MNMIMGGGAFVGIFFWLVSIVIFYFVIKLAVKNGVREAHEELIESVRAIERKLDKERV